MSRRQLRKLPVTCYVESLPSKMYTAEAVVEKLREDIGLTFSVERLNELADAFLIPHYRIDDGRPQFVFGDVRKWIGKNLTQKVNGQELPLEYRVIVQQVPGASTFEAPASLAQIKA